MPEPVTKHINKVVYNNEVLVDLTTDTVEEDKLLTGATAHDKSGALITGTMKDNAAVTGVISTKEQEYTVPQGYHDGSGKVSIDSVEQAKLIPANIREGITVLGVEGAMSGSEDSKPQTKSVTPSAEEQVILPDEGYNCLSQVTVASIPYVEAENDAGGTTITIG